MLLAQCLASCCRSFFSLDISRLVLSKCFGKEWLLDVLCRFRLFGPSWCRSNTVYDTGSWSGPSNQLKDTGLAHCISSIQIQYTNQCFELRDASFTFIENTAGLWLTIFTTQYSKKQKKRLQENVSLQRRLFYVEQQRTSTKL